jgi:hypothetical protein
MKSTNAICWSPREEPFVVDNTIYRLLALKCEDRSDSLRERKGQMLWFKVAAIAVGVLIAFIVVSSIIGLLMEVMIAVFVVAVIALGIKAIFHNKQVSGKKSDREIRY